MGQEITNTKFTDQDFSVFRTTLEQETRVLKDWLDQDILCNDGLVGGFEVESWILDSSFLPAPYNSEFIECFNSPLAVPELARFNLEFNNTPQRLEHSVFTKFYNELKQTWENAKEIANRLTFPSSLLLIGTLPTLRLADLNEKSMSDMNRYHALNEQIMIRRKDEPLHINIEGKDRLELGSNNVMLEASTTSFQIHTQVPAKYAHHYYNAALMISAPIVSLTANSPFVFGKDLWNETRIPLFEQAIDTANPNAPIKRVSFGSKFLENSIIECFNENLENFYILLPNADADNGTLMHLRLHNGTIWRWNRPLLGFDENNEPHIRIEHRVIPAGPTIVDMIANAAFFYGLSHYWALNLLDGHSLPTFKETRKNFYIMAKYGLDHTVNWFGKRISPEELILETLLPQAKTGLKYLNVSTDEIEKYLSIVYSRVNTKQTGADWQRKYVALHKCNMAELTSAYQQLQNTEAPVHTWSY